MLEEPARGDTACKPLGLGQADHKGRKLFENLLVREFLADSNQGASSLFSNNGLIRLGQLLQQGQVNNFVIVVDTGVANLLRNREEHFIVLIIDQC